MILEVSSPVPQPMSSIPLAFENGRASFARWGMALTGSDGGPPSKRWENVEPHMAHGSEPASSILDDICRQVVYSHTTLVVCFTSHIIECRYFFSVAETPIEDVRRVKTERI